MRAFRDLKSRERAFVRELRLLHCGSATDKLDPAERVALGALGLDIRPPGTPVVSRDEVLLMAAMMVLQRHRSLVVAFSDRAREVSLRQLAAVMASAGLTLPFDGFAAALLQDAGWTVDRAARGGSRGRMSRSAR